MNRRAARAVGCAAAIAACAACGPHTATSAFGPAPVRLVDEPGATAAALAVVVPGSGWEMPGLEGLTLLAALTLLEEARPALDALGAHAAVRCDPAAFTFTLVAPPDSWPDALALFLDALFRPDPSDQALDRARAAMTRALDLDRANPAWQARLGVRNALYGAGDDGSAWGGPACGVPETIGRFSLAHVRAGAFRFDPARAAAAATGDVGPRAAEILAARISGGDLPRVDAPRAIEPRPRYMERNTVTAWIALAFPFEAGADLEAMRLLGALLTESVRPGVDRPAVFDAGHEVYVHGRGGALVVHAVTAPDAAGRYAALLAGAAARWAGDGGSVSVFERVARRQRGERLRALASPEARAAELALALALGSAGHDGSGWPDAPSLARVRAAAAGLGPPARVVVGPGASRPASP